MLNDTSENQEKSEKPDIMETLAKMYQNFVNGVTDNDDEYGDDVRFHEKKPSNY